MSIWVQVTSGNGPAECCWVVAQVALAIEKEARREGTELIRLEETAAEHAGTYRSVVFSLSHAEIPSWLHAWAGTIQWVGQSPFRPHHARKNWFAAVQVLAQPEHEPCNFNSRELKIETFRASGPGGQNVNKVATAVRITHLPSGKSVTAQESRSQHQNRKLAHDRLRRLLQQQDERFQADASNMRWNQHYALVRGNPIRVYAGADFKSIH